ncbi:hypothetical protein O988_03423 [Pseudogymnoascus sp. VKM F-3808]|nr:hypothetical protein O988_03423 [Pseudogymnoascus sp. VKM F-3808]
MDILGIDSPPCPPSPWWYYRAIAEGPGLQVQLRQDDLPQVLRPPPSPCDQLQEEEVRTHQPAPPKEEAKVIYSRRSGWRLRGTVVQMDSYIVHKLRVFEIRNETFA